MKVHINATLKSGPWGGGNQFLKALRGSLEQQNRYEPQASQAHAILFNSYQDIPALFFNIITRPFVRRAWRLGPVFSLHRKGVRWKVIDYVTALVANVVAHSIIFQSQWSLSEARKRGFFRRRNVYVIPNSVDRTIFFPVNHELHNPIRLVYTSWSSNSNKGHTFLKTLDQALDWKKYEMVFVGNTPFSFDHIVTKRAASSGELADILRGSDIFISPTKDDACSNAILEAIACGLPVVGLASGGNGEIIQKAGVVTKTTEGLFEGIAQVVQYYKQYVDAAHILPIETVALRYYHAICGSIISNDTHS